MKKILPPAGVPRGLAIQNAIMGIGSGTFTTGSVVFFTQYVGLSPLQVGTGFSIISVLGLAGSLPVGHLADRIGGQRAWVIGASAAGLLFLTLPLARNFWTFILVMGLTTIGELLTNAGRAVYTAAALPREERVHTMAFARAYLNVGFTVGSGLGAAALALESRLGLVLLVVAAGLGMMANAFFVSRMPRAARAPTRETRPSPWTVLRDHPYTALASLLGLLWLSSTIFSQILPLWAISSTDVPKPILGALFALNTILAVALQVPASRGAESMAGSVRLTRNAAIATAVACPVVALSGMTRGWVTIAVLASAVLLLTLTELWGSAAEWYFQTDVPPPDQRGAYAGMNDVATGFAGVLGPAGLTFLAISTGGWGWWLIAVVFVVCAIAIRPVATWIERTPRPALGPALSPALKAPDETSQTSDESAHFEPSPPA